MNIINATDSYKLNHWNQYPEGTEKVYSYFEAREGAEWDETIFFGLQYLIEKYLVGKVVTQRDIEASAELARYHFGDEKMFNREGWQHILDEHDGKLPVRIKAIPEGTRVPVSNVMMTVENTCPKCYWLTNALESLLTHVWAPSTTATMSREIFQMIEGYVEQTGGDTSMVKFQLHDFGYRGASSHESAAIAGAGVLVNGRGTDTVPAIDLLRMYYGGRLDEIAFSVPATEHSVMTSLGENGEMRIVSNLIENYPTGILSVVGDSYDIYRFAEEMGTYFKDEIMVRDGKFVLRPDSGPPVETMVKLSQILWAHFGGTTNKKGFKVFDPHVGLLWGDGLEPAVIEEIILALIDAGFCISNYVFGMGGGLLQKINRDIQRFAFKCSAQMRNGEWFDIRKNPLDVSKASKAGRLMLEHNKSGWFTTQLTGDGSGDQDANLLKTVFEDGEMFRRYTLKEIRERADV